MLEGVPGLPGSFGRYILRVLCLFLTTLLVRSSGVSSVLNQGHIAVEIATCLEETQTKQPRLFHKHKYL